MNTIWYIWYSIDDHLHPHCDSSVRAFTVNVPKQVAEEIAKSFAQELQFILKLDDEQIKVWVQ